MANEVYTDEEIKPSLCVLATSMGGWTPIEIQSILDDIENYYKNLLKSTIPYLEEYARLVRKQNNFKRIREIGSLIYQLKDASYGTK